MDPEDERSNDGDRPEDGLERRDCDPGAAPSETFDLLSRYRAGDRRALDEIFGRCYPRVRRIVAVRTGSFLRTRIDLDDLVQSTMLRALESLGTVKRRENAHFVNWLARLCMREIARLANAERRRADAALGGAVEGSSRRPGVDPPAADRSPSSRIAGREREEVVDRCLAELPEHYREVILLKAYADASWEYVARSCGRPTAHAAEQLYQRAMQRLREVLHHRHPSF